MNNKDFVESLIKVLKLRNCFFNRLIFQKGGGSISDNNYRGCNSIDGSPVVYG